MPVEGGVGGPSGNPIFDRPEDWSCCWHCANQEDELQLRQELDELYAAFCATLPAELQPVARELPHRLRIAPAATVPWSKVFVDEVTFAAPAFFAQAMPQISPAPVREAVMAHAFAVIDALGTDRIERGEIQHSPELEEVLRRIRQASEGALVRVAGKLADDGANYPNVPRSMRQAMLAGRRIMAERAFVDFDVYEATALGKAGNRTAASVALARTAGWSVAECSAVAKTLDSTWLGLQYHDDVIDWEDDVKRDSSWAVRLALSCTLGGGHEPLEVGETRTMVLESGILARMLRRSARHFRAARKRAEALGARELATWASKKEEHATYLEQQERRNSGYAVRLHALSPWVAHVLS